MVNDFWNSDMGRRLYEHRFHTVISHFHSNYDNDAPVERDWISYSNRMNPPNNEYLRMLFIFPDTYVTKESIPSLMQEINKLPFAVTDTATGNIHRMARDENGNVTTKCMLCHGDTVKLIAEDAPYGSAVICAFGPGEVPQQEDPQMVRGLNVIIRAMVEVMYTRLGCISLMHPDANNNNNGNNNGHCIIIGTKAIGMRAQDDADANMA